MNTDRIYQGEDDRWYFNVRGNLAKGPFPTYLEAETALEVHLRQCRRPLEKPVWPSPMRALRVARQRLFEPRHP